MLLNQSPAVKHLFHKLKYLDTFLERQQYCVPSFLNKKRNKTFQIRLVSNKKIIFPQLCVRCKVNVINESCFEKNITQPRNE